MLSRRGGAVAPAETRANEAIDLADCLQFADKRTIVLNSDTLWSALGFPSKNKGKELLEALEHLRDELVHAQDIITGRWPQLVEFAQGAEKLLAAREALQPKATASASLGLSGAADGSR